MMRRGPAMANLPDNPSKTDDGVANRFPPKIGANRMSDRNRTTVLTAQRREDLIDETQKAVDVLRSRRIVVRGRGGPTALVPFRLT